MVEFISAYRERGWTPDVTEYLFPLQPGGTNEGRLWVMPAGKLMPAWHESWEGPSPYWQALAEIDWQAFYDRQDGYLVFEDMRQQWQQLEPDYVLIDTHSGITVHLGIATRQLPDAVVLLFNPHLGGKDGLDEVSWQVHEAQEQTGRPEIEQFFVLTGVMEADEKVEEEDREREFFRPLRGDHSL